MVTDAYSTQHLSRSQNTEYNIRFSNQYQITHSTISFSLLTRSPVPWWVTYGRGLILHFKDKNSNSMVVGVE